MCTASQVATSPYACPAFKTLCKFKGIAKTLWNKHSASEVLHSCIAQSVQHGCVLLGHARRANLPSQVTYLKLAAGQLRTVVITFSLGSACCRLFTVTNLKLRGHAGHFLLRPIRKHASLALLKTLQGEGQKRH